MLRHTGDGYWELDGTYTETPRKSFIIPCNIQPSYYVPSRQSNLPEGVSTRDVLAIYTTFELIIGDEKSQVKSDYIIYKDKEYEVWELQEWDSATGRTSHYKALLIRRDKLHGTV